MLECGWSKNQASIRSDLSHDSKRQKNLIKARKVVTVKSQRGFKGNSILDTLKRDEKPIDEN